MDGPVLPDSPKKLMSSLMSVRARNGALEGTHPLEMKGVENGGGSGGDGGGDGENVQILDGNGLRFELGILKDCEIQVQAFLEDADSVLAALDQCQAEEKCLMLIKKPKEAARKMLKSHSLSNLSVSDPQLYRQFNGLPLSHVHHPLPAQAAYHKGKRSSDEHSVTSTDTERSEPPRRRYVSAKGKENAKQQQQHQQQQQPQLPQQQQHRRSHPQSHKSPEYYHSDSSSSVASEYRYVSRRDRERDRDPRRRGDLRYSSIPEDAHEINNNGAKEHAGASLYHSCHDISITSQASSTATSSSCGRGQGQGQGRGRPNQGYPDQIASDQMYGGRGQLAPDVVPSIHDPGDLEDGTRSRSLGNLSTGLAFSVVGQRKADSMLDLSSNPTNPPSSSSSVRQGAPPPRSHAPARHRSEGGPCPEHLRSPDRYVRSPRHSYPDQRRTPRRSMEEDEVFTPGPCPQANGYYNNGNSQHHPPQRHRHGPHADSAPSGRQHHHPHQQQQQQQQLLQNGHAHHSSGSSTSREQTPQSDVPPPKPRRSLPHVPLNETSERIKRFTEMMRSRMSVCSSGSRSTANSSMSQTPTTPHTPPSRQASLTDNGSDCEVSTLLDARQKEPSSQRPAPEVPSGERGPQHHYHQNARGKEVVGGGGEERSRAHPHHPQAARHPSSCQETPQLYGERVSESGQTPFTSHSHSSTMDSGYTTNTEGDADSTANSSHHHLSPPNHPPPQYHHHHLHPNYHPQHVHQAQPAESSSRPGPAPRNLSLAAARKFSSMQNVSSGHGQQQAYAGHPPGPAPQSEWGGARSQAGPPHSRGPAPMRAQHPADPQVEHQRRSWDLAHNFKSLDFMPVTDSNSQRGGRAQGLEDLVVKPQALSLNVNGKHKQESGPPRRVESQRRPEVKDSGQGRVGSVKESQHVDNAVVNNTLPGHWKYNNANGVSSAHNNVNNNINSQNSPKNNNATTPRTHPRSLSNSGDCVNTPVPTLYQLSQSFTLCSAKLWLPADLSMGRLVSLTTLQVILPSDAGSPPVQSPQGRCARLGGPGSAFRPVRTGSVGGGQVTMEVVGVGAVDQQCQQLCVLGEVRVGDLLVEVNGRQCGGMERGTGQRLLDATLGEVLLTLARRKEEKTESRVQQLENSLHSLQLEVQKMKEELHKKDARIRELSTMLPWKRDEAEAGDVAAGVGEEEGAFVIGDNEFVV